MSQAQVAETHRLPEYISIKMVQEYVAPLARQTLNDWALKGWIRSVKTGATQQSRKLFRTRDILDSLDRLAKGRTPRKRR